MPGDSNALPSSTLDHCPKEAAILQRDIREFAGQKLNVSKVALDELGSSNSGVSKKARPAASKVDIAEPAGHDVDTLGIEWIESRSGEYAIPEDGPSEPTPIDDRSSQVAVDDINTFESLDRPTQGTPGNRVDFP